MHSISCLVKAPLSKERDSGSNKSTSIIEVNVFSEASAIAKKFSSSHTHTSSMKSNRSRGGSLMAGLSVIADNKAKEKSVSLSQRNRSDQKTIHSLVKSSQPNGIDKLSKEAQNAYQNEIDQNKVEIAVALVPRKKKRKMLNRMDRNKKCKSEKVNHAECVSNDSTADDSPCLQISGSPPIVNSADIKVRISNANQERSLLKPPRKKQSEMSPYVASALSPEVGKLEENENKQSCKEKIYHEVLQVDRILGCRVRNQSSYTVQTNGISTLQAENQAEGERLQFNLPCSDFIGQENHDHLDDCCADSRIVDGTNSEFELDKDQELAEKNVVDDSCEFGADKQDRALLTNHYRDIPGIIGFSDSQSSIAHCMNEKVVELFEGSVNEDLIKAPAIKKDSKGSIIVGYASDKYKDHHTRVTGIPVTSEPQDIHLITAVSKPDQSIENIVLSHPVEGLRLEENDSVSYEFFVKWVGKSNIHNSWVCEAQLKHLAKRKLDNYKAKYGTAIINICEDQWFQPQRIISLHEFDSGGEALIKWTGLPYDECTWESIDDNVIQNSFNLISEFKRFETQAVETDARYDIAKNEIKQVLSLPEQPKELKGGLLFPHQLEALNWLRRCWYKSKNVILADEMGLGKTVSACSFISSLFCEFKVKLPCLVLVPLSTMPNWLAEFASWAPHLNVVEYHGCAKARSLIRLHEWHASVSDKSHKRTKSYKFNVLLTTYEMILADSFHLRGVQWELLVVDEGHRLKNSASKLFSLLNSFSFQHRVLLTGTPLQNNIGEMYNLLNFLQPISFPSLSAFEEKFNDLTTAEKVEELKKLVAPHMLRRLKKDAMQNIPPKTERLVPVELTSVQAEYYRAMLTKNYQLLRNIGKGVAQQSMLNIVMQLRKVCNHPYLIPGTEPESGSVEFLQEMRIKASAKLSLLHSMLKILRKDGHRVLIFSQMTKLLDILEDYLTVEYGHGTFERVDGSVSVSDRQAAISRFNKDPTRFVFLLSTRSCGLGINLATADTVFIYDSDFNPHADIQAMNRAHRIGQSKRLLVYRLVVRASVEERILQLAKRKLMLDQLFVNKSGSQKEVEDILRWGTKELFSDYDAVNGQTSKDNSINKVDCTSFREQKHRRRIGGLGDVYKDRCTDVGSKVIWDENAIIKLLDRSDLQTNMSENTDGDLDIDLLGSVKSLEWTDEQLNGESGGTETIAHLTGNGCELSVTKEDNSFTVTDENEWDRLLRDRWGKYQLEEEALLGRGKRLRKAVSYRENFTSIPKENLIENANEDESVKEYSIAGRALREKYMMLRARQKGRIASRNTMEVNSSGEQPDPLMQSPIPDSKEGQHANSNVHSEDSSNLGPLATPYCSKYSQSFDAKDSDCSSRKQGRTSYHGIHLSLSGLSSDRNPPNFVPSSMLLPVLGLCAPNAGLKNSTSQNFYSPINRSASNPDLSKKSICLPEFPFAPVLTRGPLIDNYEAGQETTELSLLSDTPGEARHHRLKKIIPDSYFPFGPPVLPTSRICPSDPSANLGTSFTSFRERMGLPNLVSDEVAPLKYAVPSGASLKLQTDLPHLSLCSNIKLENVSGKDLPDVPLPRCFEPQFNEALKQKQVMTELLPALNIGLLQTGHSLPETHTKLLDSIMFNAQTDAQEFIKKRLKADAWSEDELDALWIGIRRHGKGNWGAIVGDSKLKILKRRSVEELLSKWNEEQHKILDGPVPTPKISKSASFLGLSDGMMARALHSSKFASSGTELPKFRSHLTDIQLGFDDVVPSFPFLEPSSHSEVPNESLPSLSSLRSHKHDANYFGNFSSGSVERFGMENLPLEQAFHCSSFSGSVGTSGMKFSSSCNMQQDDDVSARNKRMKLPSLLEKSLSLLRETQNFQFEGSRLGVLRDAKRMQATSKSQIEDIPCGSKENELPHWLREAVNAPKHPVAALPPSISAISYSIRVLFGENKFIIPPFIIPEPPSLLPTDPRKRLKKKRKWNKLGQAISGNLSPADIMDISAACSLPAKSPLMEYSDAPVPPFIPYSIPPASSYLISSAPTLPPSSIPVIPSLMPCFTSSTLPLMTSSLPQVPLMFPFKYPHSLPMMPSSIHQSPTFISSSATASTALPPPFLPESALLPSTSQAPSLMFGSIPPLSPKRKYSSPVDSPPMPCPVPLARCLPGLGRNGTEFTLPSLNLNLNFPSTFYGVQTMQSGAIPSPIPATLSLVAPCLDHAPSMSSISDVPCTSNQDKKFLASDSSDCSHQVGVDFVGDLKNIPYEADGSYELTRMLPGKTEY